jgi:hypothetical protein
VDIGRDQIKWLHCKSSNKCEINVTGHETLANRRKTEMFCVLQCIYIPVLCLWKTGLQLAPSGTTWGTLHTSHCKCKIQATSEVLYATEGVIWAMSLGIGIPELAIWALLVGRVQEDTTV